MSWQICCRFAQSLASKWWPFFTSGKNHLWCFDAFCWPVPVWNPLKNAKCYICGKKMEEKTAQDHIFCQGREQYVQDSSELWYTFVLDWCLFFVNSCRCDLLPSTKRGDMTGWFQRNWAFSNPSGFESLDQHMAKNHHCSQCPNHNNFSNHPNVEKMIRRPTCSLTVESFLLQRTTTYHNTCGIWLPSTSETPDGWVWRDKQSLKAGGAMFGLLRSLDIHVWKALNHWLYTILSLCTVCIFL